MTIIDRKKL